MTQLSYGVTLFSSLLVEALPFLMLGTVVSSVLLVFVDGHQLAARLPHHRVLGAIVGSMLGLVLPVCQYGNVPVARRFLLQGIPIPVAMSFLIAAPTINPIVIGLTWRAFPDRPGLVVLRVLFVGVIATIIACIFSTYPERPLPASVPGNAYIESRSTLLRSGTFLMPSTEGKLLHRAGNLIYEYKTVTMANQPLSLTLTLFLDNLIRELLELGSVLVLGCAIAAAIQLFLPQAQILNWGQTPSTGILVMLLLGFILSLGSLASVFFISAFFPNFLSGSLLAFLVLGSIVDLKGIGLMLSVFRPKVAIYLTILVGQITFLLTLLLDFYVG
jgi:uncharacterized membrane protein YraQ (UPF0718 family)